MIDCGKIINRYFFVLFMRLLKELLEAWHCALILAEKRTVHQMENETG